MRIATGCHQCPVLPGNGLRLACLSLIQIESGSRPPFLLPGPANGPKFMKHHVKQRSPARIFSRRIENRHTNINKIGVKLCFCLISGTQSAPAVSGHSEVGIMKHKGSIYY